MLRSTIGTVLFLCFFNYFFVKVIWNFPNQVSSLPNGFLDLFNTGFREQDAPAVSARSLKKVVDYLGELYVNDRNSQIAETAITALGAVGGEGAGSLLVERLEDVDYPAEQKPEIILALGKMKYTGAVDALIAILDNKDEERIWRIYAAASLGEIGDQRAIPRLRALFAESDSLIKAYAAAALSKFDMSEVENLLQQGLRVLRGVCRPSNCHCLQK